MSKKNRRKAEVVEPVVEATAAAAEEVQPIGEQVEQVEPSVGLSAEDFAKLDEGMEFGVFVPVEQTKPEAGLTGNQVVDDEPDDEQVVEAAAEVVAAAEHAVELLTELVEQLPVRTLDRAEFEQGVNDPEQGVNLRLDPTNQAAAIDEANARRAVQEFAEATVAPIEPQEPPYQPAEPAEPAKSSEPAPPDGADSMVQVGKPTAEELAAKIEALQATINAARGKSRVASGSRPRPNVKYTLLKKPAAWAGTPQLAQLQKILFSPEVEEKFKKEDGQVEMTEPEIFAIVEAGQKAGMLRTTQPPVRILQYYRSSLLNANCLRWQ